MKVTVVMHRQIESIQKENALLWAVVEAVRDYDREMEAGGSSPRYRSALEKLDQLQKESEGK